MRNFELYNLLIAINFVLLIGIKTEYFTVQTIEILYSPLVTNMLHTL